MSTHHNIKDSFIMAGWLLLFSVATSLAVMAQDTREEDEIDLLLDDLLYSEQQFVDDLLQSFYRYNFLYANISMESNTYFSGRDPGVDQINLVPQLSYYNSTGFNLSVSGIYYESYAPHWDFTKVYAGYYNSIGKNEIFTYDVGYSHYFYSDGWDVFTNSVSIGLGLRNKKRSLGTRLTGSYLFGTDQTFQLASRTYARVTLVQKSNYVLRFRPQINFILAEQTIELERMDPGGADPLPEYEYEDVFGLLNTQINLPLALSTRSWDFELGYNINLPNPQESEPELDPNGFFHISIGYLIDLNK